MIQKDGRSALLVACLKGYLDIVKLLVENKANVLLKNKVVVLFESYAYRKGAMRLDMLHTRIITRLSIFFWRMALIPTTPTMLLLMCVAMNRREETPSTLPACKAVMKW